MVDTRFANYIVFECCSKTVCVDCEGPYPDCFCKGEAPLASGFFKCPHCSVLIEATSGCKFMCCESPVCKGRRFFCMICNKKLRANQHYSHYKKDGPFGDVCNTLCGIPDDNF